MVGGEVCRLNGQGWEFRVMDQEYVFGIFLVQESICQCPLQRTYLINVVTLPNILDTQDIFIKEMNEIITLKFLKGVECFISLLDAIASDINTT